MVFEGQFKIEWDYYERLYNPETKEHLFRKVKERPEYFVKHPQGTYRSLLGDIPLAKKIGFPTKKIKNSDEFYSLIPQNNINILKNYWNFDQSKTKYNLNPRTWFLDIETTATEKINVEKANEELVLIQIYDNELDTMLVIGSEKWDYNNSYFKENIDSELQNTKVKYFFVKDEFQLFETYFRLLKKLKPFVILGWNTLGFDYPFLFNRAKKLGLDTDRFSCFEYPCSLHLKRYDNGTVSYTFNTPGVFYMDYMELYKKFIYKPRESYSLDYISSVELNKNKIQHDMYSTFDGMRTGENYIFPEKEPEDLYNLKMYKLQKQQKENPSNETKTKIKELANDLFVYYGIIDTFRLKEIDDKLRLKDSALSMASKMGININEVFGTVTPWANFIEKYAYQKNLILPPDKKSDIDTVEMKGGYVSEPKTGKHKWIVSIDINSAYPNLSIRGFNMSPETYVPIKDLPKDLKQDIIEYFSDEDEEKRIELYLNEPNTFLSVTQKLKKYKYSLGINGAVFTQEKRGIIPELVGKIYSERKEQKNKMIEYKRKATEKKEQGLDPSYEEYMATQYNTQQMISKILINALFGALSNKHFRLFNIEIGKAITGNTRFYIHLLNKRLQDYLGSVVKDDYIIYNDTDSVYITVDPIIEKLIEKDRLQNDEQKITDWIDGFVKDKIDKVIEDTNNEFSDILNAYDKSVIQAEREVIASSGLWLSKKKYILKVLDNEGVRYHDKPDLKIMGVEIAKSSTPKYFKQKLKDSIDIILEGDIGDMKEYLDSIKKEVTHQPLPDISKTIGIGSLNYDLDNPKFDATGRKIAVPINSRAALVYNRYIKSHPELSKRYNEIQTGDKIKIAYLKTPNPFKSDIIAFNDQRFEEVIKDYIDYDSIYDKFFLSPLEIMSEPIGWKDKLTNNTEVLDEW